MEEVELGFGLEQGGRGQGEGGGFGRGVLLDEVREREMMLGEKLR